MHGLETLVALNQQSQDEFDLAQAKAGINLALDRQRSLLLDLANLFVPGARTREEDKKE